MCLTLKQGIVQETSICLLLELVCYRPLSSSMPPPSPLPTYLYKVLSIVPPLPLPKALPLSTLDAKDGFIHLSTAEQTPKTAGRFFSDTTNLWLLKIPLQRIKQNVKWEEGNSGCFAHLYDQGLGRNEVVDTESMARGEGDKRETVLGKEQWLA